MSNPILKTVAAETGESLETLRKSIKTTPVRGTDFIKITAYHDNRPTAVLIANSVAHSYIQYLTKAETERAKEALAALDEELQKQSEVVQERRKSLTVLIQQYSLHHSHNQEGNSESLTPEELHRKAQEKLAELKQDSTQLKIQIDQLSKASGEDLIHAAAKLALPSGQASSHYINYRESIESVASLRAQGLGSNHPEIKAIMSQANEALSKAEAEVISLRDVLKTRLKLITRQIKRFEAMIGTQSCGNDFSIQQHHYMQAQADYENARDMLSQMKLKQEEARTRLKKPRTPATLYELAQ